MNNYKKELLNYYRYKKDFKKINTLYDKEKLIQKISDSIDNLLMDDTLIFDIDKNYLMKSNKLQKRLKKLFFKTCNID